MICVRNIGMPCEAVRAFGAFADSVHDSLTASGTYDLPPGYQYDPNTLTVYSPKGVDEFKTAQLRQAVAFEKNAKAADQARADAEAKIAAANAQIQADIQRARGVTPALSIGGFTAPLPDYSAPAPALPAIYAAPLSTLPAPLPILTPPGPPAPVTPSPAEQQALVVAQAAQLVAQYAPYVAQAQTYASQLSAAGRLTEAGQWLDYSRQLSQWLDSLRSTYNVN